jgi:SAM-dependent methyltransferase
MLGWLALALSLGVARCAMIDERVAEIEAEHAKTSAAQLSNYELKQASKLSPKKLDRIRIMDRNVESSLALHFGTRAPWTLPGYSLRGKAILCVGARLGGEVRALTGLGALAVGIDFNPGVRNPWVQWGDATRIQFANATFDYVYTNVVDHIAPLPRFLADAMRVLRSGGRLVLHVAHNKRDAWSVQTFEQQAGGTAGLLRQVEQQHGFTLTSRKRYAGSGMKRETVDVLLATFDGGEELIFDKNA